MTSTLLRKQVKKLTLDKLFEQLFTTSTARIPLIHLLIAKYDLHVFYVKSPSLFIKRYVNNNMLRYLKLNFYSRHFRHIIFRFRFIKKKK